MNILSSRYAQGYSLQTVCDSITLANRRKCRIDFPILGAVLKLVGIPYGKLFFSSSSSKDTL
jgi:hypothetical protein